MNDAVRTKGTVTFSAIEQFVLISTSRDETKRTWAPALFFGIWQSYVSYLLNCWINSSHSYRWIINLIPSAYLVCFCADTCLGGNHENGGDITIEPSFRVDYGCNIHAGRDFYLNFNVGILDVAEVDVGTTNIPFRIGTKAQQHLSTAQLMSTNRGSTSGNIVHRVVNQAH